EPIQPRPPTRPRRARSPRHGNRRPHHQPSARLGHPARRLARRMPAHAPRPRSRPRPPRRLLRLPLQPHPGLRPKRRLRPARRARLRLRIRPHHPHPRRDHRRLRRAPLSLHRRPLPHARRTHGTSLATRRLPTRRCILFLGTLLRDPHRRRLGSPRRHPRPPRPPPRRLVCHPRPALPLALVARPSPHRTARLRRRHALPPHLSPPRSPLPGTTPHKPPFAPRRFRPYG